MTGQPTNIFLSETAILRAFAAAHTCTDCVTSDSGEKVLIIDLARGDWGVLRRHAVTCPQLTPEQRAAADEFWDGLHEHDESDEERFGVPDA